MNSIDNIINIISGGQYDIIFKFNGLESGIAADVSNNIFSYVVWYGENISQFSDLEDALGSKIFEGKSFKEILDTFFIQYV